MQPPAQYIRPSVTHCIVIRSAVAPVLFVLTFGAVGTPIDVRGEDAAFRELPVCDCGEIGVVTFKEAIWDAGEFRVWIGKLRASRTERRPAADEEIFGIGIEVLVERLNERGNRTVDESAPAAVQDADNVLNGMKREDALTICHAHGEDEIGRIGDDAVRLFRA